MAEIKKFICGLFFIGIIIYLLICTVSHFSNQANLINKQRISSLVDSYSSYFFESHDKNLEELEQLKYTHFSNNAKNISSETVYRSRNVTVEDTVLLYPVPLSISKTYKRTNFMEVFHYDSELELMKINFSFLKDRIVLSSNFGQHDCQQFSEKLLEKNPKLKLEINNVNIKNIQSISGVCDNQYNIVLVTLIK